MNKPVAFAAVAALSLALLAGCGNKGPLVRPSDAPPPAQAMPAIAPAPAADDAILPDLTPPAQPPATDAVAPADGTTGVDATTPPPPVPGDGG